MSEPIQPFSEPSPRARAGLDHPAPTVLNEHQHKKARQGVGGGYPEGRVSEAFVRQSRGTAPRPGF